MGFFQAEVGEMEASPAARRARVQTGPRALIGVKFPFLIDGERAGAAGEGVALAVGVLSPGKCIGSCPWLRHQSSTTALSCSVSPSPLCVPITSPCPHERSVSPPPA